MPQTFERPGFQFQYPDDWTVDEEQADGAISVSAHGPHGSFWALSIHPGGVAPEHLLAQFVAEMREQYPDLDASPTAGEVAGSPCVGVEVNFVCLDFTSTAIAQAFAGSRATYLVLSQAEDRDFERLAPVFAAIARSLSV